MTVTYTRLLPCVVPQHADALGVTEDVPSAPARLRVPLSFHAVTISIAAPLLDCCYSDTTVHTVDVAASFALFCFFGRTVAFLESGHGSSGITVYWKWWERRVGGGWGEGRGRGG